MDALGVAALPGSEVLLNRSSDRMVPCNLNICPNAVSALCATSVSPVGLERLGRWVR